MNTNDKMMLVVLAAFFGGVALVIWIDVFRKLMRIRREKNIKDMARQAVEDTIGMLGPPPSPRHSMGIDPRVMPRQYRCTPLVPGEATCSGELLPGQRRGSRV